MLSAGQPYLTGLPPDTTNRDLEERKKLELKLKMEKDQPWELPEWVREVTGWDIKVPIIPELSWAFFQSVVSTAGWRYRVHMSRYISPRKLEEREKRKKRAATKSKKLDNKQKAEKIKKETKVELTSEEDKAVPVVSWKFLGWLDGLGRFYNVVHLKRGNLNGQTSSLMRVNSHRKITRWAHG